MSYAIIRNEKYKRENLKGQVKTASNKEMLLIKLLVVNFGKLKIYIQLQNAFYSYITENGFDLERGKSLSREHLSVKDYKKITNYEKSKQTLRDIKIELPNVTSIKDFGKLTVKRDERIQKEIIEPKDKIINMLCSDNKKYDELLSENIYLNKIINTFEKTIKKFISWVCKKFAISEKDDLIRDFQQETTTFINPDKQIEYEQEQEEYEL